MKMKTESQLEPKQIISKTQSVYKYLYIFSYDDWSSLTYKMFERYLKRALKIPPKRYQKIKKVIRLFNLDPI